MKDVIDFIQTPKYHNFFAEKKLTNNLIKRCIIEPFCSKFINKENSKEIEKSLTENMETLKLMNEILAHLTKDDLGTEH